MNKTSILTSRQKQFLQLFGKKKSFSNQFYLTGGTALAAFYIPYRFSEDLDFFSEKEVQVDAITVFIRSIKEKLGFESFDFNTSFNRNIFFLIFKEEELKLEFTYFPFPQINKPRVEEEIRVDSIEDIAVNKLFTIYQQPRSRDFLDLYQICKKYGFSVKELIKKAKVKFDWHVDPLKLGSQFLLSKKLKDYPKLIETLEENEWISFFEEEAKKIGRQILEE